MTEETTLVFQPRDAVNEMIVKSKVSSSLDIDINRIKKIDIIKKSIDARQRNVKVILTLRAHIDNIETPGDYNFSYPVLPENAPSVIIVGAGPAGLFAALQLIRSGIRPLIFERGKDVDSRRKDLAMISRNQKVDFDSNYCFGEGGAGTFSDGKLYTRSKKRGSVQEVLQILHQHGAKENILYEAHPHIGSDCLPGIIKNIRKTILEAGGHIYFNTRVENLLIDDLQVKGIVTANGQEFLGRVILATGHSARDTFRMLDKLNVAMEAKGIAVGVRLEHPQELIDRIQYHSEKGRGRFLPPAEYSLVTQIDERGVYSFCMCPGGVIVPSASGDRQSVVNGMSASARGSRWANAAMVVQVKPEDVCGNSPLKILEYQEQIENDFFDAAQGSQKAPAQRLTDFINAKKSATLENSSYAPGIFSARIDQLLPPNISSRLRKGLIEFGKKKRGFITPQATLVGAETRTSSPVRIPRNAETFEHPQFKGLCPVGEGAGWAGGIVSSALDGLNAARAIARNINQA